MNTRTFFLFILVITTARATAQTRSSAMIDCFIGDARPGDTIRLHVWNDNLSERSTHNVPYRSFIGTNKDGHFRFRIDSLVHPVYFSLVKDMELTFGSYLSFIPQYLLEPGDHLNIRIDSLRPTYVRFYGDTTDSMMGYRTVGVHFSGEGSEKNAFTFSLDSSTQHWLQTSYTRKQPFDTHPPDKVDSAYYASFPGRLERMYEDNKAILDYKLSLLEENKKSMSDLAYRITKVNLIGETEAADVRAYSLSMPGKGDPNVSETFRLSLAAQFRKVYDEHAKVAIPDSDRFVLPLSKDYINYVTEYAYYLSPMGKGKEYDYLKENYTGVFRDKLITDFLLKDFFYLNNSQEVLRDAVSTVQSNFSAGLITKLYNNQGTGRTAYNFALPDTKGGIRKLSDLRGKVVFVDLWYTGCGACSKFYKYQLSRVEEKFKDNPDVTFVTISIDKEKQTWLTSVQSGYYTSSDQENVVNLYTAGRGTEDPLITAYNVTGYPHPFMIDRNGKIYKVNKLQALAEDLIPIIDEAIAKDKPANKKKLPKSTLNKTML